MRITKVKVDNKDVIMQRDEQEGYLLCGEKSIKSEARIEQFIQGDKIKSIKQSLINTLLRKYPEDNGALCQKAKNKQKSLKEIQDTHKMLTNIIEQLIDKTQISNQLFNSVNIDFDLLACCFKSTFYDAKNYQQLLDTFAFNDNERFSLLQGSWLGIWINKKLTKYQYTAKSIKYNRISYQIRNSKDTCQEEQLTISKKKLFFNSVLHKTIDEGCDAAKVLEKILTKIAEKYKLSCLLKNLKEEVVTSNENNKKNLITDKYRKYKYYLQKIHQPKIFGTKEFPINRDCIELYIYHNEFVAYLEYYFPINEKVEYIDDQKISVFLDEKKVTYIIFNQLLNKFRQYLLLNGKIAHQKILNKLDVEIDIDSRLLQQIKLTETLRRKLSDDITFAANRLKNQLIKPVDEKLDFVSIISNSECYINHLSWKRSARTAEVQQSKLRSTTQLIEKLNPLAFTQLNEYKFFLTEHPDAHRYEGKKIGDHNAQYGQLYQKLADFFEGIKRCKESEYPTYKKILSRLNELDFLNDETSIIIPILQKIHNINNRTSYQSLRDLRNTVFHVKDNINQKENLVEIKALLDMDCNNAKNTIIEGLHSNNTLRFYNKETIEKILDIELSISYKSQAFAPSLNNVLYRAENLKKEWAINIPKREPSYYARYYLLNLLYYHAFLPVFLNDIFSVQSALNKIKVRLVKEKEKFKKNDAAAIAYDDFITLADNCFKEKIFTVSNFLAAIQRMATDAISKAEKQQIEAKTHYQRFLQDLFLFGFDIFLSNKIMLLKPNDSANQNYYQQNGLKTAISDFANNIKIAKFNFNREDNNLLHWYNLLKLLDNNRLNQLKGELLKYRQAQENLKFKDVLLQVDCDDLIELVQLSLLYADKTVLSYDLNDAENEMEQLKLRQLLCNFVDFNANDIETLKPFEPINPKQGDRQQLYLSGDNIIRHKTLDKIEKYHTSYLFEELAFKLPKVTINDCQTFLQQEKDIVAINQSREELHKKWIDSKGRNKRIFSDADKNLYNEKIKQEQDFVTLKNKITLFNIERLNNLFNDIWSHWISLAYLWERDLYYAALALLNYKSLLNNKKITSDLAKDTSKVNFVYSDIDSNTRCVLFSLFLPEIHRDIAKDIRNAIVHYRYLSNLGDKSLLGYLTDIRTLMSYDRKLKNAVAKSFIDLLDKHGIMIKFAPLHDNQHQFVIEEIKSKQIEHLGGTVKINQHPQEYINMVRALLELGEKPKVDS